MAVWRKPSNAFDTPGFTLITRSLAGRVSLGTAEETVARQSEETHIRPMMERASLEANLKKRFQARLPDNGENMVLDIGGHPCTYCFESIALTPLPSILC